jgi:hypothetical protein
MNRLRMIPATTPTCDSPDDPSSETEGDDPRSRPRDLVKGRPIAPVIAYPGTEAERWAHFRSSLRATLSTFVVALALLALFFGLVAACGRL